MTASIALLGAATMLAGIDNAIKAFGNDKQRMPKGKRAFAYLLISAACMYFLVNSN